MTKNLSRGGQGNLDKHNRNTCSGISPDFMLNFTQFQADKQEYFTLLHTSPSSKGSKNSDQLFNSIMR
jgi:hypothetical protein